MQKGGFSRRYVMLRPLRGGARGFARLEMRQGRGCVGIQLSQAPQTPLRALMLSGDAATGAVIDLGLLRAAPGGQAALYREELPSGWGLCHTLAVCTDWPDPTLCLYGWLTPSPACTLWQLQEALSRYLALPMQDAEAPAPLPAQAALCTLLPE